jgi:rubrerythrin
MDDDLRKLINRTEKPIKVKKCVECGYILTSKVIPDNCPQCKLAVIK